VGQFGISPAYDLLVANLAVDYHSEHVEQFAGVRRFPRFSPYRRLERVTRRLTGHPAYVEHVQHLRTLRTMHGEGEARGLALLESVHYGVGPARTLLVCVFQSLAGLVTSSGHGFGIEDPSLVAPATILH
jgi:hypothetical protein